MQTHSSYIYGYSKDQSCTMKILALLFLVGCATAYLHDEFDQAAEDQDALQGRLKDKMKEIMDKLKDRKKYSVEDPLQGRLKDKAKEIMEKLKDRKKFSDEDPMRAFDMKAIFQKLKNLLNDKIDKEALKAKIENLFGKGNDMADNLLKIINEKGDKYKQKLLDLVDRYLGKDENEVEQRSVSEVWEKIREYFKNLNIDLKEKYAKFGEWVKEKLDKGMEQGKSKLENIKNIAKEFRDHTKGVSKEVAVEALEFLKPYKEDLGSLWDQVKETVKDIMSRKE